ncbi:carbohydrate porin [uncultured Marinobacter sp.]|uniref:carbohydrate porin n=1 Tax=uncultured Marinobacter sp. TaxID=187379 RepID=UPI000C41CCC2|nr:carbohydrate porin [Halomonas sp.]|tara:strand:- start:35676 stop:37127 length:1452 start_codon:yes stop_codon:yes gene_type:complete
MATRNDRSLPACLTALSVLIGGMAPFAALADEQDKAELVKKLEGMEQRIRELEQEQVRMQRSLDEPYISASEPEVSARLKAVESQVYSYRQAARTIESLEGISADAGLTMMAQGLNNSGAASKSSELNYRGDASVRLPAGTLGNATEGFIFAHFRMGQGLGLENPGSAFASLNSTSFQRPGTEASDSTALLAQAWYQLDVPLPLGGNPDLSRRHIEVNFGKMDPFVFFDQNAVSDDETRSFVNQAFVHNPLLDVGGDVGVDEFGFTPGLRLAYIDDYAKPKQYTVSLGVFGSGKGASFNESLDSPFVILQAGTEQRMFTGLSGNYRIYAWRNGRGTDLDGAIGSHTGLGLSFNQQVADYTRLFLRAGWQTQGRVTFDRTLTLGGEWGGSYWGRGADALGLAMGWLWVSDDFRREASTLDTDGNGVADYGYRASGSEQIAELYYRYWLNNQFTLSPNLQYIRNPGGNGQAANVAAAGLRAQFGF